MPYLSPEAKELADKQGPLQGPGDLNYRITKLLIRYWQNSPRNYQSINDVVGAVEGAKLEFYRRLVAPYEDSKIKSNGDVYPC